MNFANPDFLLFSPKFRHGVAATILNRKFYAWQCCGLGAVAFPHAAAYSQVRETDTLFRG